jgi:hypothetical protein
MNSYPTSVARQPKALDGVSLALATFEQLIHWEAREFAEHAGRDLAKVRLTPTHLRPEASVRLLRPAPAPAPAPAARAASHSARSATRLRPGRPPICPPAAAGPWAGARWRSSPNCERSGSRPASTCAASTRPPNWSRMCGRSGVQSPDRFRAQTASERRHQVGPARPLRSDRAPLTGSGRPRRERLPGLGHADRRQTSPGHLLGLPSGRRQAVAFRRVRPARRPFARPPPRRARAAGVARQGRAAGKPGACLGRG